GADPESAPLLLQAEPCDGLRVAPPRVMRISVSTMSRLPNRLAPLPSAGAPNPCRAVPHVGAVSPHADEGLVAQAPRGTGWGTRAVVTLPEKRDEVGHLPLRLDGRLLNSVQASSCIRTSIGVPQHTTLF